MKGILIILTVFMLSCSNYDIKQCGYCMGDINKHQHGWITSRIQYNNNEKYGEVHVWCSKIIKLENN